MYRRAFLQAAAGTPVGIMMAALLPGVQAKPPTPPVKPREKGPLRNTDMLLFGNVSAGQRHLRWTISHLPRIAPYDAAGVSGLIAAIDVAFLRPPWGNVVHEYVLPRQEVQMRTAIAGLRVDFPGPAMDMLLAQLDWSLDQFVVE